MNWRSVFVPQDIVKIGIGCVLMSGAALYSFTWKGVDLGGIFLGCAIFCGGVVLAGPVTISGLVKVFRANMDEWRNKRRGPLLFLTDVIKENPYDAAGLFLAMGIASASACVLKFMVDSHVGH